MRSVLRISLTAVGLLAGAAVTANAAPLHHQDHSAAAKQQVRSPKAAQVSAAMRDLWLGHVFWVRNVAVATVNRNETAAKAAEQQVVANAQAIAAAIEPFYGAPAKEQLFGLLAGHYGGVKAHILATVAASKEGQQTAIQAMTANAEEIAVFLSKANPNLPKDAVNGLLLAHAGHHMQQVQELKAGNYTAEAKTWEEMKTHMYQIADAMSDALAKQFARRF